MMRPVPSMTELTMRASIGSRCAGREPADCSTRATVAAADPSPGAARHPLPASGERDLARDPSPREAGRRCREAADEGRCYRPNTAFLKSEPGPGFGPIHVARIASAVAFPGSVPLTLPFTLTVVPVPGT